MAGSGDPGVRGSLRLTVVGLDGMDPEQISHVEVTIGSVCRATPRRVSGSVIEETFFFPVTPSTKHVAVSLWMEGRKMGNANVTLDILLAADDGNDMKLSFEKFGSVRIRTSWIPFPPTAGSTPGGRGVPIDAYGDMSLREIYLHQCLNFGLRKPNSGVVNLLPDTHAMGEALTVLKLDGNTLGDKGVRPLLEVVRVCSALEVLNLDSNGLANGAAQSIRYALRKHPSLRALSVCQNEFFEEAGQELLLLLQANDNLTTLKVWGNDLTAYLLKRIARQLEANTRLQEQRRLKEQSTRQTFLDRGEDLRHPCSLTARCRAMVQQAWESLLSRPDVLASFCRHYEVGIEAAIDNTFVRGLFSSVEWARAKEAASRAPTPGETPPPDGAERPPSPSSIGEVPPAPLVGQTAQLFLQMLENVIPALGEWAVALPLLQDLGAFYAAHGVSGVHYDMVEGVWVESMRRVMPEQEFTTEVEEFSRKVFVLITRTMARGLEGGTA